MVGTSNKESATALFLFHTSRYCISYSPATSLSISSKCKRTLERQSNPFLEMDGYKSAPDLSPKSPLGGNLARHLCPSTILLSTSSFQRRISILSSGERPHQCSEQKWHIRAGTIYITCHDLMITRSAKGASGLTQCRYLIQSADTVLTQSRP